MITDWDTGPVIADSIETLMRRLDVKRHDDGTLQASWEAFSQRLRWQIGAESHLVLRHKGITVKKLCSMHDTSGVYLSAIMHAFEDTEGLCRAYGIDADSDLTLDLDLEVQVHPGIPMTEEEIRVDMDRTKVYRPTLSEGWYQHDAARMVTLMAPMTEEEAYAANCALDADLVAARTVIARHRLWTSAGKDSLSAPTQEVLAWMEGERNRVNALAEAVDVSAWDIMEKIK